MVTVVEITPDYVLVDGNHPLAGQSLDYELTVREVRDATAAEIATAVAEFELAREDALGADDGRTRIENKHKLN
jgi:FKBP-type peptidyl-prolyl cis-trans isomerase 2